MWLSFSFNMNIYPMTAYGQCHIHLNQIIYYIRRKNIVAPVLSGSFLAAVIFHLFSQGSAVSPRGLVAYGLEQRQHHVAHHPS